MPQLDNVTLFSQVFWLITLYFLFFIVFLKYYLPNFSNLFKVSQYYEQSFEESLPPIGLLQSSLPSTFTQWGVFLSNILTSTTQQYYGAVHRINQIWLNGIHNLFNFIYVYSCLKVAFFNNGSLIRDL